MSLLEKGAPGVIASTYVVPDSACSDIAVAFYRECSSYCVGEAMRRARAALDASGLNPVAWSTFTLHGDPNWWLAATGHRTPPSRELTADALSYIGRFAASRSDEDRRSALAMLPAHLSKADGAGGVAEWIATAFTPLVPEDAARERMCLEIAARDRYAAATLRALLCIERLDPRVRQTQGHEVALGTTLALRLHDDFLLSALAAAVAARGVGDLSLRQTVALLDAGSALASGLAAWDARFAVVAETIEKARTVLGSMRLIDASRPETDLIMERERIADATASSAPVFVGRSGCFA